MKIVFTILFLSLLNGLHAQELKLLDNSKFSLVFKDDFKEGQLDTSIWHCRTDSKHWSTQTPGNVVLENGILKLIVRKESLNDKEYTGAGIISKKEFGYGYYEARMKIPHGAGWHNSFWLMTHEGSGGTDPKLTELELDICENDSKNKNGYNVNVHHWPEPHFQRGTKWIATPDLSENFHVFGCLYEKDTVTYYFDKNKVQVIPIADLKFKPLNIWLTSIASFHGNTTKVDDSQLPSAFEIDYVAYYKNIDEK